MTDEMKSRIEKKISDDKAKLSKIVNEYRNLKIFLSNLRFINIDLKSSIIESYKEKIDSTETEIDSMVNYLQGE